MNQKGNDIFISYSRRDFDDVYQMVSNIKAAVPGIKIWFDITGIESGDEFEEKIVNAIDDSNTLLFALSENSIKSEWVKSEVLYAKNSGKRVIPVLLNGAELTGWFLFKLGSIDCIRIDNELQWKKLISDLKGWFSKEESADKGPKDAKLQYQLGYRYYTGKGIAQDRKEAVKWFTKSAEQGFAAAQDILGWCYNKGEGVEQNYAEAVKWYKLAAVQGIANAQYNLGVCYFNGRGVDKDYLSAKAWYKRAAAQNYTLALCNLGDCYCREKRYGEAMQCFRKAAEQGNAKAAEKLKLLEQRYKKTNT
jgi:TPR repeat protein